MTAHRFEVGSPEWCDFLVAYFEELRKEINLRVTAYTNLVGAKVVTTGALVGFLLTQTDDQDLRLLGLLLAPLIGLLYDVLISKNIKAIHTLGIYVRDHVEHWFAGTWWEHFAGQRKRGEWGGRPPERLGRNYGIPDILVLGALDAGLMGVAVWQARRNDLAEWMLPGLVAAYAVLLVLALVLMWRNILFEMPVSTRLEEPPLA